MTTHGLQLLCNRPETLTQWKSESVTGSWRLYPSSSWNIPWTYWQRWKISKWDSTKHLIVSWRECSTCNTEQYLLIKKTCAFKCNLAKLRFSFLPLSPSQENGHFVGLPVNPGIPYWEHRSHWDKVYVGHRLSLWWVISLINLLCVFWGQIKYLPTFLTSYFVLKHFSIVLICLHFKTILKHFNQ